MPGTLQIFHIRAAGAASQDAVGSAQPLEWASTRTTCALAAEEAASSSEPAGETITDAAPSETRSLGAQKFHIPFTIDSSEARSLAQAQLDKATAILNQKKGERDGMKQRIAEMREKIDQLSSSGTGGGPFGIHVPGSLLATEWKLKLAAEMQFEPLADEQTAAAETEKLRCDRALQLLDQIDRIKGDANAYTLMIVCDRIPKSPDADPTLFVNG